MRTHLAAASFGMALACALPSRADIVTVSRPIDNFLGSALDHTYTVNEQFQCVNQFGGGCDCAGQSQCVWHEWGNACGSDAQAQACGDWIDAHWTYGIQGVCHQATNNEAWYAACHDMSGDGIRGYGLSVSMFGTYGTDDSGCQ